MRTLRTLTACVFVIPVLSAILGCHPLDRVAWGIEEYGTISVSAPMLVPVEKAKQFTFDLDKSAEFYFNADRVEGAVRLIRQESFDVQIAMKVQIEQLLSTLAQMKTAKTPGAIEQIRQKLTKEALGIAALQQAAKGAAGASAISGNPALQAGLSFLLDALGGASQPPEQDPGTPKENVPDEAAPAGTLAEQMTEAAEQVMPPTTTQTPSGDPGAGAMAQPEFKSLLPLPRPAKDVLSSEKFSATLDRFDGKVSISPRQALMLAANDKMTQDLFKWFAQPSGYGKNKKAYFCMMTVSCQPGYWTRKNFTGDVMVTTAYARDDKSKKKKVCSWDKGKEGDVQPHVSAVYPMVDAQVLDLRQSLREQTASAIQVALLGFGSQAEALIDSVERIEQDAQSQTALTVGSAYSIGGRSFGFRIEPRFVALEQPARKRSGPGNILEATQFPVMMLLMLDKADISETLGDDSCTGHYDQLAFAVESRWLPNDWWTALWWRQSEYEMITRARRLDQLQSEDPEWTFGRPRPLVLPRLGDRILSLNGLLSNEGSLEIATVKRRTRMLASAGLGSTMYVRLPEFKVIEPTVDAPDKLQHSGWCNAVSVFTVHGKNFSEETVKGATVGNRNCAVQVVGSKSVVVTCDAWGDETMPSSYEDLVLITTFGPKKAGQVKFDHHYKMKTEEARPSVTIDRAPDGNIKGIKITGDFGDAQHLLQIIRKSLLCCDGNEHHVCVTCGCLYHGTGPCNCTKHTPHRGHGKKHVPHDGWQENTPGPDDAGQAPKDDPSKCEERADEEDVKRREKADKSKNAPAQAPG